MKCIFFFWGPFGHDLLLVYSRVRFFALRDALLNAIFAEKTPPTSPLHSKNTPGILLILFPFRETFVPVDSGVTALLCCVGLYPTLGLLGTFSQFSTSALPSSPSLPPTRFSGCSRLSKQIVFSLPVRNTGLGARESVLHKQACGHHHRPFS